MLIGGGKGPMVQGMDHVGVMGQGSDLVVGALKNPRLR